MSDCKSSTHTSEACMYFALLSYGLL